MSAAKKIEPRAVNPDSPANRPMSCRALASLFFCDAYFEHDGRFWVWIYEPLAVDAPADARPYCYGLGDIDFYDSTGNETLARHVRCHHFGGGDGLVLLSDRKWYEVTGGQCVYREGRWYMRWNAARNSRGAHMANHGWPAYNNPDLDIRFRRKVAVWFGSKGHRLNSKIRDNWYYFKQHLQALTRRYYRIYFERWKGELYLTPRIRLTWPRYEPGAKGYSLCIDWLKWGVHVVVFAGVDPKSGAGE